MSNHDFESGYFDGYSRVPPAKNTPEYMHGYNIGLAVEQPCTFYHRTDAAAAILSEGFRDTSGSYGLASLELCGVFISDIPLGIDEGAVGEDLFEIEIPAHVDIREYELIQPRSPYREWCVPADLLNNRCAVRLLNADAKTEPQVLP